MSGRKIAFRFIGVSAWLAVVGLCRPAAAQLEFEHPPINYMETTPTGPVAELQADLAAGRKTLKFDEDRGYLVSLLKALGIPSSSQVLVNSKTSLQLHRISTRRPRALYFNDDTYVGWVQGGGVMEISTVDPKIGMVFYTLDQRENAHPELVRDRGQCLTCHASSRTMGIPGLLMRSVYVNGSGQPQYGSGTYDTTNASPFEQRWGGWYVTGTHGSMRHMGNAILQPQQQPDDLDLDAGANVTDLSGRFKIDPYLEPTSDIVSLMILQHQVEVHNLLTLANFETRVALQSNAVMNEALERDSDLLSESTQRRIASVTEKLLRGMLMSGEYVLTSPVRGDEKFAEMFQKQGPRDRQGRSLRELDLETRLFKYPFSYLISTSTFDALPAEARQQFCRRLQEILDGRDTSGHYAHLTAADRTNIRGILQDIKPELLRPVQSIQNPASVKVSTSEEVDTSP
jgi:hypothetical protein